MQTLASRLRLARAASGLNLAEVVERLGEDPENASLAYRALLAWEDGRLNPKGEHVARLAALYGVSEVWLRTGAFPPPFDGSPAAWDGCVTDVGTRPGSTNATTLHRVTHRAVWLVGEAAWRVCDACAKHPSMRKVKPRKKIKRAGAGAMEETA